jgi:polyketide cyclase/dehydrase/lipid transport protein
MRWILYVVAAVALLALIVAVVGAMLPRTHSVSRTAHVKMPPDALFTLLTDVSQYATWRPDVKSLQRLPDKNGMPAWIEETGGMKIPMRIERMERPTVIVGRIDSSELAFGGTWTYRIAPAPGGSELTITEDGEVHNVIFRFMSRFVFGHYATLDAFLVNLARLEDRKK